MKTIQFYLNVIYGRLHRVTKFKIIVPHFNEIINFCLNSEKWIEQFELCTLHTTMQTFCRDSR